MNDMQVSETVFACHSRACAPPPTGKGGSSKGAKSSGRNPGPGGSLYTKSGAKRTTLDAVRRFKSDPHWSIHE